MAETMSKATRSMLERIASQGDSGLMQLQITSNGRSQFNKMQSLVWRGWAEVCEIVLQEGRAPVPGVRITDAGRQALAQ